MDKRTTSFYRCLGRRVKFLRHHYPDGTKRPKPMSQGDLANVLGIHRQTVANLETGRRQIPVHMLFELSQCFAIPFEDFLATVSEIGSSKLTKAGADKVIYVKGGVETDDPDLAEIINEQLRLSTERTEDY